MSGSFQTEKRLDLPELWRALEELEDGTLAESHHAELADLLNRSPAARRAYLEYFQQSAVVRMEAAKLHERGLLPFVGSANQTRRVLQRSVLAAAALVALGAVIAALVVVARPEPGRMSAVVTAETRWSIDSSNQKSGADPVTVKEGSTVRVLSGTLRLKLESGDLLVLQGPATVSFPELHRPQLQEGWLWIDAEKSDQPFEVGTPRLRVRDIGTRFGVRVPEDGPDEVHLVSGRVEIRNAGSGKLLADLKDGGKAFSVTAKGEIEGLSMAVDPFPALPDLLKRPADYRTTVVGQAPVGYWTFDELDTRSFVNEIPASSAGFASQDVRLGEPAAGSEDGFPGFSENHHSLFLKGSPQKSVVAGIDGLHGVRRKEGAVSFWIRREGGQTARDEMLWLAGFGSEALKVPLRAIFHTHLARSGQVVFEIEGEGVLLTSSGSIRDGRWHHVAASWSPSSAELFVDGVAVGREQRPRILEQGNFRGRFVRFGKPSLEQMEAFDSFTGWVDEIALWDRPLGPVEVSCQFDSAVGNRKQD